MYIKGSEDAERFATLERLLQRCRGEGRCGTASRQAAEKALDRVHEVVWSIPETIEGFRVENRINDQPFNTSVVLMHEVLDGVAAQIESLTAALGQSRKL